MKIAIVGTGVSGLVAAHHLHRQHEITVYEAAARIGGHTHTVSVPDPGDGRGGGAAGQTDVAIDTGFIVFNDRNYPNFEALLGELGVAAQPSHMSFSVSDGRGGFEFSGTPWGLFARPAHLLSPTFLRMLREWDIKSTWFIPGHTADAFPATVAKVAEDGHEIAGAGAALTQCVVGGDAGAQQGRCVDRG